LGYGDRGVPGTIEGMAEYILDTEGGSRHHRRNVRIYILHK
jgi:hypothetical protein